MATGKRTEDGEARSRTRHFGMYVFKKLYQNRGIVLAFGSACFYSVATVCIKALEGDVPSNEIVFTRVFIILSLALISTVHKGVQLLPLSLRELRYHIGNAIILSTCWSLQVYAYHHMRAADASAIVYSYITFVGIFARIFLKERLRIFDGIFVVFTLIGVLLIAQPSFIFGLSEEDDEGVSYGINRIVPVLAAFSSSILAAASVTISRFLLSDMAVTTLRLTNWNAFFCLVFISVILTVLDEWMVPPCVKSRLLCVANGVLSFVAFVMLGYALSTENSLYIALATLSEVYIVFIFDIVIFSIQPKWLNALGIAIIVTSSAAVTIRKTVSANGYGQVGSERKGEKDSTDLSNEDEKAVYDQTV